MNFSFPREMSQSYPQGAGDHVALTVYLCDFAHLRFASLGAGSFYFDSPECTVGLYLPLLCAGRLYLCCNEERNLRDCRTSLTALLLGMIVILLVPFQAFPQDLVLVSSDISTTRDCFLRCSHRCGECTLSGNAAGRWSYYQ